MLRDDEPSFGLFLLLLVLFCVLFCFQLFYAAQIHRLALLKTWSSLFF
jgi:hypothetical protein